MKQGELWRNEVVKDRQKILAYLAQCRAILHGGKPLLNAGQAHTGAWFWKQTNWNEYTLVGGKHTHTFNDYGKLYAFCKERGIDATQA